MQPDIPVGPKLFKYRLDTLNLASQYEFSTIELNQEHPILVDINMGMRINLVDREIYAINPTNAHSQKPVAEGNIKLAEELRRTCLSERDRFLLSDKDTLPSFNTSGQLVSQSVAEHALLMK